MILFLVCVDCSIYFLIIAYRPVLTEIKAKEIRCNESLFENTEHVLTSLTHAFCLQNNIKLCLKEFSAHSKSKKLNVSKINILGLARYVLSAVQTLQETRSRREGS